MKTAQIQEIESMDEVVFGKTSEIVQVGFTSDKATLLQIAKSCESIKRDEITFEMTDEGIMMREMDASHVALIDVSIPNSCFEKWSCLESTKFAVNIRDFRLMLNSLDAKGSVSIVIREKEIVIKQNGFSASLKKIEASEIDVPLPRIPFDARIEFSDEQEISVADFVKTIKKIDSVCEYVEIDTTDQKIVLSTDEENKCSMQYDKEQCELNINADSESKYSLEYLMPFLKTLPNTKIEIDYSSQKPIRISFRVNNMGRIDFYLAPRVEN